jgi:hypothetical protein
MENQEDQQEPGTSKTPSSSKKHSRKKHWQKESTNDPDPRKGKKQKVSVDELIQLGYSQAAISEFLGENQKPSDPAGVVVQVLPLPSVQRKGDLLTRRDILDLHQHFRRAAVQGQPISIAQRTQSLPIPTRIEIGSRLMNKDIIPDNNLETIDAWMETFEHEDFFDTILAYFQETEMESLLERIRFLFVN